MKTKKIPLRMCVACQEMKDKRSLIRVVRNPEGEIQTDKSGKKSGRGAYICLCAECIDKARKEKRLDRVLKDTVPPEIYKELHDMLEVK